MKKFYLQVREDNIITDAIEYPYENYVEIESEILPPGVYGGWFKLIDGQIIEVPELKPIDEKTAIEQLQNEINDLREQNNHLVETLDMVLVDLIPSLLLGGESV